MLLRGGRPSLPPSQRTERERHYKVISSFILTLFGFTMTFAHRHSALLLVRADAMVPPEREAASQ